MLTFRQLGEVAEKATESLKLKTKIQRKNKARNKHETRHFAKLLVMGSAFSV
jgi:hypothetical protein